ncbi:MAG: hypothetical protein U9R52_02785 [Candidatus Omnitrophota bacterium]|nr:hypothetical protein [Candidatus Omnitrophota bacterium]
MKVKKWITNNIGLKILSLILAMATWYYIAWELEKIRDEEEMSIFSMLHYDVISKKLPIQLALVGDAIKGYEIITDGITIDPRFCVVIGPKRILGNIDSARTMPLDISEHTKDVDKQLSLAPIAKGIILKDDFVKVHIPIVEKKEAAVKETK